MCHVAAEMERQGFELPLLIGGATTSRVHTAVKISPNYRRGQSVHVNDASRAVGVVSALLSDAVRPQYSLMSASEYARIAAAHTRSQQDRQRSVTHHAARANRPKLDWVRYLLANKAAVPRYAGFHRLRRYNELVAIY